MIYAAEKIKALSYDKDGSKLDLNYKVLMESMYFSPGVNLRTEEGKVYLDIVRCKLNEECPTQFKSEYLEDGSQKVQVETNHDVSEIYIYGSEEIKPISSL